MGNRRILSLAVLIVCILQIVSALPDSTTSVSGDVCTCRHSMRYSYSVTAPKTVQVGDTFAVSLGFSLTAESRLNRAPTQTSAKLSGSNVELLSNPEQQYSNTGTWRLRATEAGMANLSFATEFFINGDDPAHRGYSATFRDTVDFTIEIRKPAETSIGNAPPGNWINPTTNQTPEGHTPSATLSGDEFGDIRSNNTQVITAEFEGGLNEVSDTSWITTRVIGLLAYSMLFLSVLTALLKKSHHNKRLTALFKHHHDISILSLLLALFHAVSNIFDEYAWNLSPYEVFVPRFETDTQVWISIGIIAFYAMALVTLTSLGGSTIRKLGAKKWRYIHMGSYITFLLVFAHSLLLGTDLQQGPLLYAVWASGLVILALSMDVFLHKIFRVRK